ncbi:chromate resistance protein ChrB domain-containing protein [Chitinophaga pollutisoli]|uniref:Chromate resistance protein ChrB domain-containing protein n=1 Tax=Chitinophaga pollutisoli TaxID=3133966 RepID=A0ABZ2YMG7_9BACT
MKWVTCEHPTLDRIACIWLIRKFIDPEADITYLPEPRVIFFARAEKATPFGIKGTDYFTYGEHQCLFDIFLRRHPLPDPALPVMSPVIRCLTPIRNEPCPQAAGFRAIAEGLALNFPPGDALTGQGIIYYDALYSWARQLPGITKPPAYSEHALMEVFHRFLTQRYAERKPKPEWMQELSALVQDQIDTNICISLPGLARKLDANPYYLNNEFSNDLEDMSFGEYIRKKRMEKAVDLMEQEKYSLTEIAYMTGFSDLGHFSRLFNYHYGKTPTGHLKTIRAQKNREAQPIEEKEEN